MSFVFKNTTDSGIVIGREKTPYEKTLNKYYAIPIILTFFAFVLLKANALRDLHPMIAIGLPAAGLIIVFLYKRNTRWISL